MRWRVLAAVRQRTAALRGVWQRIRTLLHRRWRRNVAAAAAHNISGVHCVGQNELEVQELGQFVVLSGREGWSLHDAELHLNQRVVAATCCAAAARTRASLAQLHIQGREKKTTDVSWWWSASRKHRLPNIQKRKIRKDVTACTYVVKMLVFRSLDTWKRGDCGHHSFNHSHVDRSGLWVRVRSRDWTRTMN